MKVALVYDRVNKFGGAERLMLALHSIYPDAPIYTLVHDKTTSEWANDIQIIPTFLNKVPFFRKRHELLAPIAPLAFETLDLSEFDVVISVTSSDAKSIITKPNQLHICYCLTPTRYFWSGEGEYSEDIKMKLIPDFLKSYFRSIDLLTSTRPDEYISISNEVEKRVKKYYKRDSEVIYPPIEDKFYSFNPISIHNREYFLVVSRLVPYKKVDLVIEAFNKLKFPLVIIGSGNEENILKSKAGGNISFLGQVEDHRLLEYYRRAKAVIFPQLEDFGLVPLEAQALGTPVIAYAGGGALETVIPGKTGYLFEEQTPNSLIDAVKKFSGRSFSPIECIENAREFNYSGFKKNFAGHVDKLWKKHSKI